jgi:hypothetical protein
MQERESNTGDRGVQFRCSWVGQSCRNDRRWGVSGVNLTKPQREALDAVCRTNGGGVSVRCRRDPETGFGIPLNASYRKLYDLGLIQGKSGSYETVVHTREGLALYRSPSPSAGGVK